MNVATLFEDIDFLCGSTSGTYPITSKVRNMNVAYQDVARVIWEADGAWQYDDINATGLPIATTDMVHDQQDYSVPTTCQRIESVIIKDSEGNWKKLMPLDIHDTSVALPEYLSTPDLPLYYDLIGSSIMLYPSPNSASVTLVSGLRIYMNRDVSELTTGGTGTTPGFATPFHRILSLSAAIDFEQDSKQREFLAFQKQRLEKGLTLFYSKRGSEFKTRIAPKTKKAWRQYT